MKLPGDARAGSNIPISRKPSKFDLWVLRQFGLYYSGIGRTNRGSGVGPAQGGAVWRSVAGAGPWADGG